MTGPLLDLAGEAAGMLAAVVGMPDLRAVLDADAGALVEVPR